MDHSNENLLADVAGGLATAGQLARKMGCSGEGVRKALKRKEIKPAATLGKVSYFNRETAIAALGETLRSYTRRTQP